MDSSVVKQGYLTKRAVRGVGSNRRRLADGATLAERCMRLFARRGYSIANIRAQLRRRWAAYQLSSPPSTSNTLTAKRPLALSSSVGRSYLSWRSSILA